METMEAQAALPMTDHGRPTMKEIQDHELTHLSHRSWCAACVAGRSRDRAHNRQRKSDGSLEVPLAVMDSCFQGSAGEQETIAVQVAWNVGTKMFSHFVPKKGVSVPHTALEGH